MHLSLVFMLYCANPYHTQNALLKSFSNLIFHMSKILIILFPILLWYEINHGVSMSAHSIKFFYNEKKSSPWNNPVDCMWMTINKFYPNLFHPLTLLFSCVLTNSPHSFLLLNLKVFKLLFGCRTSKQHLNGLFDRIINNS